MTHRCTLHVTVAHAGELPAVVEAIEALGAAVECPAHDARERLRERDSFLLQALELMNGDTPRKKCRELAAAIARFDSTTWPRWRDYGTPPGGSTGISAVQSLLFQARQLGPLPATPEQLWNIAMKRKAACDFTSRPLQLPPDLE
jgi:hypothetical protein